MKCAPGDAQDASNGFVSVVGLNVCSWLWKQWLLKHFTVEQILCDIIERAWTNLQMDQMPADGLLAFPRVTSTVSMPWCPKYIGMIRFPGSDFSGN